jgi:hypothetical protein
MLHSGQYHSLSELRDLISHIDRFSVGIQARLYEPIDRDFIDLSHQLEGISTQLKTFLKQKSSLTLMKDAY